VTIAFGLRNLSDIGEALKEMKRVLKVNGHVLILEFSIPTLSFLRGSYRFYLHRCLPLVGSFLTQQKQAYDYLGDSIEEFPSGEAMIRSLQTSGFEDARFQPLTGGIVTIYTAQKTR
jgi:demethylmenaquinone methyltransferase/2-methoxy-6-polyprenyl-1,4-benzoquinol methylase